MMHKTKYGVQKTFFLNLRIQYFKKYIPKTERRTSTAEKMFPTEKEK